ncbi:hypothetical protein EB796_020414 [Bugula neritina]|uniref:Uncharacterized protein n=1 Tax=Bugula neritina TaxID=10212 RepID=A0A7J7J5W9_BUGNE|nr:hypothetical protein EB796_020414 [Bugula neritina]
MLTVKERRRSFTSDVPVNHKNGADSSSGAKVPSVSLKADQSAVLVTSIASLPSPAVHSSATPPSPAVPNSATPPSPAVPNSATPPSPAVPNLATPPSPAVPNSATPPSTSSSSPEGKKKTVTKKVVKRTVSVKRTIIPTFDDDLAGAPSNDGSCWNQVYDKSGLFKPGQGQIPVTKSEWGENVYVEERMKKFKKEQEAIGKLITGRNWGPVTKV